MAGTAEQMTTADAARVLGVSARQVRYFVDSGELAAAGRIGSNLMLDAASVQRLAGRGSQRGRPWSEQTIWAAVELLDDGRTKRLNDSQRSRLRTRLRGMGTEELVRLARRRSEVFRYRASTSFLERLRDHVTLTAAAAIAGNRSVAAEFDLASGDSSTVDGYVDRALLRDYEDEFFLVADLRGNVVLRTTQAGVGDGTPRGRTASETLIALDLADSLDTRERSAGLRVLGDKLRQL